VKLLALLFTTDYAAGCTYGGEQLGAVLAAAPLTLDPPRRCAVALLSQSPALQAEAATRMAAMGRGDLPRIDTFLVWVQVADGDAAASYDDITTTVYDALKGATVEATGGGAGTGSCVLPVPRATVDTLKGAAVGLWSSIELPTEGAP
jgi:hypothetical protein